MIECASLAVRRNVFRFAVTGLVGIWLSGCSSDSSRFAESGNPFSNPFNTASNEPAPTPRVSSRPLASAKTTNPSFAAVAHPSPVAVAALPTPAPESTGQIRTASAPVGGSATGWTAVGGTPVIVGSSDSLDTLSRRYGVPTAALLSANGLRSGGDIHGGMHIVIPIYNQRGHAVAATETDKPERRKVAEVDEDDRKSAKKLHKSKDDSDDADNSDESEKRHKHARAEKDADRDDRADRERKSERQAKADREDKSDREAKADRKHKSDREAKADREEKNDREAKANRESRSDREAKSDRDGKSDREAKSERVKGEKDKVADRSDKADKKERVAKTEKSDKADKTEKVAKADPPKTEHKKSTTDMTQTGTLTPAAPAKDETSKQADASGASPEFRWPARGRIIQGFKTGGNEGINIAVPEGTSVRAAEDGKVAYAGNALKGYGNLVLIRHPNGFVTAYANNGELSVRSGDTVKRGQVIAKSGQTGDVNSPQLHFELRKGQTPVDPTSYLAGL